MAMDRLMPICPSCSDEEQRTWDEQRDARRQMKQKKKGK